MLKRFNMSTTKRKEKGECPFNVASTIEGMAPARDRAMAKWMRRRRYIEKVGTTKRYMEGGLYVG